MEGHDTGLRTETHQREHKQQGSTRTSSCGYVLELERASLLTQQDKKQEQKGRAQVGRNKIGETCLPHPWIIMFESDQEKGTQRHDFPRNQEKHGVARRKHDCHAGYQDVEEKPGNGERPVFTVRGEVFVAEDGGQAGEQKKRQQKECGKRVHSEVQ